ncbi:hypothetical protein C5167_006926 [Papaver somniferum]|uniref:Uncharacterized protein n=1 Tax=Papaver somniferum TaxID=3469 RepID=A0A4Y7JII8_PAPSO|nr:hypothetical protein C5167_006926 [Papaver somniferum]
MIVPIRIPSVTARTNTTCTAKQSRNYQTIMAEGIASLIKLRMSWNASFEKPVQVLSHLPEYLT